MYLKSFPLKKLTAMNKCSRKRNSNCWAISKTIEVSERDNQTHITKFLIKQQENKQLKHTIRLPDASVPLLNDLPISCYSSLPSSTCRNLKDPFECKENCMKSGQDCNEHAVGTSNVNNNSEQIKKVREKKMCKQMVTNNCQLTDYFPVRRSCRKTVSNAKKEKQNLLEDAVLSGKEDGFEIKDFPGKGRGVITKKPIKRGEFVLEYYGELIDYEEAKKREAIYSTKDNTGCYMYYFKYKNKKFCIDATKETSRLGRLVNHSKKGNLKTQPFFIKESPHLVFLAGRDIEPGEELSYDYGDRRKVAVESHPWLAL